MLRIGPRIPSGRRKPRDNPEHRLQCALADHIRMVGRRDMWWSALPFGEFRAKRTAAKLKAAGVRPGAPDLAFLFGGHFYGLEVKVKGGTQSEEQIRTEAEIATGGGTYAVGKGLDQCLDILRGWGVLPADYGYVPSRRLQMPLGLTEAA